MEESKNSGVYRNAGRKSLGDRKCVFAGRVPADVHVEISKKARKFVEDELKKYKSKKKKL